MPAKDGTGPTGQGPKTGRQMGNCEDATPLGRSLGRGLGPCGRGLALGRGLGRGMGRRFGNRTTEPINLSKKNEKKILEAELNEIALEKQEIEKRLKEME